jgi:hypothetical protein
MPLVAPTPPPTVMVPEFRIVTPAALAAMP